MKRKTFVWIAITVACTIVLAQAGEAQTMVKVGNILPLSGPSASVGLQNKQAQDMAVEEINAGRRHQVARRREDPDDLRRLRVQAREGCGRGRALHQHREGRRADRLLELGGVLSCFSGGRACRHALHRTGVGGRQDHRAGLQVHVPHRRQGRLVRTRPVRLPGRDSRRSSTSSCPPWPLSTRTATGARGWPSSWKKLAEQGGYKVVLDEPYPSTATDLSPVAQKIKRANPDVLMLTSNAADAILLTNTMAELQGEAQGHHLERRRPCRPVLPEGRGQERALSF